MKIRVETHAVGEPRDKVLPLPEVLKISISRQDGYAPSAPEIIAALEIALEGMKKPKKWA